MVLQNRLQKHAQSIILLLENYRNRSSQALLALQISSITREVRFALWLCEKIHGTCLRDPLINDVGLSHDR